MNIPDKEEMELEQGALSSRQLAVLVIFFTIGTSILLVPSYLVVEAKQDAWISALIGMGAGTLFALLYVKLAQLYPDKTFVQYCEIILGKWLGKLVALIYLLFILIFESFVLKDIGEFLVTHIIVETPIQFIMIIFMLLVIVASRLGIGTLARSADIFFPLFFRRTINRNVSSKQVGFLVDESKRADSALCH